MKKVIWRYSARFARRTEAEDGAMVRAGAWRAGCPERFYQPS
jgi:hypothetical protein